MTNTTTRVILFLSSYAPLFLILVLRFWKGANGVALVFAGLTVVSLFIFYIFLRAVRHRAATSIELKSVSPLAGDSMSYLFTYLLPFLSLDLADPLYLAALGLFFLIIAVIYVRSNMIYINPILSLSGYHIFRVETELGKEMALITKRAHVPGNSVTEAVRLGDYVLYENTQ